MKRENVDRLRMEQGAMVNKAEPDEAKEEGKEGGKLLIGFLSLMCRFQDGFFSPPPRPAIAIATATAAVATIRTAATVTIADFL